MQDYLLCYDISDPRRLAKIRRISYGYALGGQKSALEAPLDAMGLREYVDKVMPILTDGDKINIIRVYDNPVIFGKGDILNFDRGVILL